jgi:glycosyltransferase involved in cell wall biosynthesis
VKTAALLLRRRPRIVFVQSPPTPAVFLVVLYSRLTGGRFVVDAHSDAMLSPFWTRPRWLYRAVARRALATIVTNEHFAGTIRRAGGTALVIRDVPTTYAADGRVEVEEGFTVLVVSSFAPDEPVAKVMDAVGSLEGTVAYVTGDPRRAGASLLETAPDNVRFTGFLPNDRYYGLMGAVDAVVCLTTRDHTMQRGACEALWMRRPILTSDWPLLREYFSKGAVHVPPTTAAIRDGLEELRRNHLTYVEQIEQLRVERRREWQQALGSLVTLIDPTQSPGHGEGERT